MHKRASLRTWRARGSRRSRRRSSCRARNSDELQGIFRVCYDLLVELGKEARWATYEHDVHGFVYVRRNEAGVYAPDAVQRQVVADSIAFFNEHLKGSK